MNLAEPQEVLPFTIFGSARYRSSNSEHHRREPVTAELWNTADWGRMGRRFPHWGLGAWECQPLTDQRTKKNRSEEHTSELQSQSNLVCRLLLETKNGIAPSQQPL